MNSTNNNNNNNNNSNKNQNYCRKNNNHNSNKGNDKARTSLPSLPVPEWRSIAIVTAGPATTTIPAGISSQLPRPKGFIRQSPASVSSYCSPDESIREGSNSTSHLDDLETQQRPSSSSSFYSNGRNNWSPTQLQPIPLFYPLERSSRLVQDGADLATVVSRISEANRLLSIHAVYCNKSATASLVTSEYVEMHVALWKTTPTTNGEDDDNDDDDDDDDDDAGGGIIVEIQRRNGDAIAFHRYSRCLLDAATEGVADIQEHIHQNGGRKSSTTPKDATEENALDEAIHAIEIAHGLLMKDRLDAQQLGLESLSLLTDPEKTNTITALLASHVVLLGTITAVNHDLQRSGQSVAASAATTEMLPDDERPFQEIQQTILSLIRYSRIGNDAYDYDDDTDTDDVNDNDDDEHSTSILLHNLALAVLANALDVIEKNEEESLLSSNPDQDVSSSSTLSSSSSTTTNRKRLDSAESISERFLEDAAAAAAASQEDRCSSPSHDTENRTTGIVTTLLHELEKAGSQPHTACLSVQCLGSLCRSTETALVRAKDLGAKSFVQTAFDIGTRTHWKLQRECANVLTTVF